MDPPTAYVFPGAYDRITVLKGPQTVLYGPGNSAGTVLFERTYNRASQASTGGQASLMLGSFGRNDEMLSAKTGSERYYLRADATNTHSDDYKDGSGKYSAFSDTPAGVPTPHWAGRRTRTPAWS